jgi:rare lipoprotein A
MDLSRLLLLVSIGAAALVSTANAETGVASVYTARHGKKTASGEGYDRSTLNAAHKHLPFGARVKVTNQANGKSIVVRINDRGPFIRGRIIDLTPAGADLLGIDGLAKVTIEPAPIKKTASAIPVIELEPLPLSFEDRWRGEWRNR